MAQVKISMGDEAIRLVTNTWRPTGFTKHGYAVDAKGKVRTNALLNREEWEKLDQEVYRMARQQLGAYADLIAARLTSETTLAEYLATWRVASERIAADVSMDLRTRRTYDRIDKKTYGVPIPIISAAYEIGARELMASRAAGSDIDTVEAEEATEAVMEKAEDMLISGDASVAVMGNDIAGYTTHTARDTGTATAYGGGDFATEGNARKTVLGMIAALAAKRYHGPFQCYVANGQYHEMLNRHTDGSGQTELSTVLELPQVEGVKPNDLLADENLVMAQMTRKVVDIRIALSLENRQWDAPDGSASFFVVMLAVVPRLKQDYAGNLGVAHATGC